MKTHAPANDLNGGRFFVSPAPHFTSSSSYCFCPSVPVKGSRRASAGYATPTAQSRAGRRVAAMAPVRWAAHDDHELCYSVLAEMSPPLLPSKAPVPAAGVAAADAAAAAPPRLPLFGSAPVHLSHDRTTHLEVVEDVAGYTGGSVWCLDWCPNQLQPGVKHLALESRTQTTNCTTPAITTKTAMATETTKDTTCDDMAAAAEAAAATTGAGAGRGHTFDELGGSGGDAMVQVWTLSSGSAGGSDVDMGPGASSSKRKRPPGEIIASSSCEMVLAVAHEGGFAHDVKWCRDPSNLNYTADVGVRGGESGAPSEQSVSGGRGGEGGGDGGKVIGVLAAALGNGRVEAWAVPDPSSLFALPAPETGKGKADLSASAGGRPPVVRCTPVHQTSKPEPCTPNPKPCTPNPKP